MNEENPFKKAMSILNKKIPEILEEGAKKKLIKKLGETVIKDILTTAKELTEKDRNKSYGSIKENMQKTISIFYQFTGIGMTPNQAIMFMVAHKLGRESCRHKRDNLVDACGYLRLLDEEYDRK